MIMYARALYRSFKVKWIGKVYFPTHVLFIGPPKQDRKQSIKNKNNRSLSFHFDLFSGCRFVRFPDFRLYLTNY